MPVNNLRHAGVVSTKDLWDAYRIYREHNGYFVKTGHYGQFIKLAQKILKKRTVRVNIPKGAVGNEKRYMWNGFVLYPNINLDNPAEIAQLSGVFTDSVTENNVPNPSKRVEDIIKA
jgi:hypothetical protein